MKPISMLKLSVSLLAFVAMAASSSLQAATPGNAAMDGKAEVKKVVGSANVKEGDILHAGASITTGHDSYVEVWLGDNGQLLRIDKDTEVKIDELKLEKVANDPEIKATTKLDLKKGGLIGEVKKLSKASQYDVKHAQGVAGIRGTSYAILPGQGVICTSGTVLVTFIVNGIPSAPITLGANQVALPPATPGGPPVIVTVSPELAAILNFIAGKFQQIADRRGPGGRGHNDGPPPSAFTGLGGTEVEVEVQVPQ